jgi:hypothetical protein
MREALVASQDSQATAFLTLWTKKRSLREGEDRSRR